MSDLKFLYKAAIQNAVEQALDELESKWENLSVYFKYPEYIRKAIYTTNEVEAVHRQFRKLTKTKVGSAN